MKNDELLQEYKISYSTKGKLFGLSLAIFLLIVSLFFFSIIIYSILFTSMTIYEILGYIIFILISIFLFYFGISPIYAYHSKKENVKLYKYGISTVNLNLFFKPIEDFLSFNEIKSIEIEEDKLIIKRHNKKWFIINREDFFNDYDEILKRFSNLYSSYKSQK